jgi:Tol biopolymer transport system component
LLYVSIPQPPEKLGGLFITENGKTYTTTASIFDMTPAVVTIYRAAADGSNAAAFPGLPSDSWNPAFSSDGQTLYFAHSEADNVELYSLAFGGGQPVNLSNNPADDHSPVQPLLPAAP